MYEEFLEALLAYVKALNALDKTVYQKADELLTPYMQFVPVMLEGVLCGFLVDEGVGYMYHEVTDEEEEWWAKAPFNKGQY